ncbi:DNA methyltransferase [Clostridium sp. UBA7791]|uniref:DNA methyltransferase n=1 Tax=Clostridium sp. UBA7791 TaxID=1946379 RepID=UPI00321704A4
MNEQVCKITAEIPLDIDNGCILDINTTKVTDYTHGFHKYPGKFIPQLPRWAMRKYLKKGEGKCIIDPFCGSGTTLVEGLLYGHNVIGIDIDPLSVLISKVKTTKLNVDEVNRISQWILDNMENTEKKFKPKCETINHWFTNDSIKKLSKIRALIDDIDVVFGSNKEIIDIKEFLIICFSSIIRRASNADNQSQKTYVSGTKIKEPEEVYNLFRKQVNLYVDRIKEFSNELNDGIESKVICFSNNRDLNNKLENLKVDLAISSPPYIKSIDYVYNQMAELFWIGDLFEMDTQEKQNIKKEKYIGTSKIFKNEYEEYNPNISKLNIEELDEKLGGIFVNDIKNGHKHSYITYKYFVEMEKHFKEMSRNLKKEAHYIMIVGNSTVSNTLFNTSQYLIEIAERNGFQLVNKWGYKIKNHFMGFDRKGRGGKIEIDWVMDFVLREF